METAEKYQELHRDGVATEMGALDAEREIEEDREWGYKPPPRRSA
jgi:hypothetical protein